MITAANDLLKTFDALSSAERQEVAVEILRRSATDIDLGMGIFVKRVGRSVLLIPTDVSPWDVFAASVDQFSEDFMADRMQPSHQQREAAFE